MLHLDSKDLRGKSEAEYTALAKRIAEAARQPPNGEVKQIDGRIKEFEHVFSMTSTEFRQRIANGSIEETMEVNRWWMLLELRDGLGGQ